MTAGSTGIGGPGSSPVVQPIAVKPATPRRTIRIAAPRPIAPDLLPASGGVGNVQLAAPVAEGAGLLAQPGVERLVRRQTLRGRIVAHVLRDLHRAEVRSAHRAEVRALGRRGRQRLVVELARGVGIERQVELVFPTELEAGPTERVVALLRARVPLGQIGRVRRNLVRYDAVL